jgi:4-carboxymuconolactone decarboxylase
MKIFKAADAPVTPADPGTFTGAAVTQRLAADTTGVPVALYWVEFADGGRTHWHTHSGPQWLFVINGHIRVQAWGEPPRDLQTGDVAVIPPGEKHWHGAAPAATGTHLAVNVNATTEWLEPVADDPIGGAKRSGDWGWGW